MCELLFDVRTKFSCRLSTVGIARFILFKLSIEASVSNPSILVTDVTQVRRLLRGTERLYGSYA